jgi:NIMA (never in mitosis gene a)-related kinase 1/4/5
MEAFQRVKVIGKGAFGAAVLVKRGGSQYVIKEVLLEGLSAKDKLEAQNEAKVLKQLGHPSIVKYVDSGMQHGKLWIAMEYCSGGDLDEYINAKRKAGVFLNEAEAMGVFAQLCWALSYLHESHILHRDLKSKNVFLLAPASSGKPPIVKLGDFGISKVRLIRMVLCVFVRTTQPCVHHCTQTDCNAFCSSWSAKKKGAI